MKYGGGKTGGKGVLPMNYTKIMKKTSELNPRNPPQDQHQHVETYFQIY